MTLTTNGIKTAEVQSGYMAHFESRGVYELSENVVAHFFDENGNHSSQLTAESAIIHDNKNEMVARKNVVVVSDSGYTLLTEELYWDNKREVIFTDEFITLIHESDSLFGHGFESDRSLKNYEIRNVSGSAIRKTGGKNKER